MNEKLFFDCITMRNEIAKIVNRNKSTLFAKQKKILLYLHLRYDISSMFILNYVDEIIIFMKRRKPYINKQNQKKKLTFAKIFVTKDNIFWKKIIFSNQSKFNIFNSDGRNYVWRRSNTELDIQNVRSIIKHNSVRLHSI